MLCIQSHLAIGEEHHAEALVKPECRSVAVHEVLALVRPSLEGITIKNDLRINERECHLQLNKQVTCKEMTRK